MTNFGSMFKEEKRAQNQSLRDEDVDTIIEGEFSIWFRDNVSGIYVPDSHYFSIFGVLYHLLKHANGLGAQTSAC